MKTAQYKMQKLILVLLSVTIVQVCFGQEKEPVATLKNEFGMQLGATTGYGFSYRHWFNKFGLQTTGFYGKQDIQFASAGLTFLYSVRESDASRFYLYWAHSYFYVKEGQSDDYYYDDELYEINSYNIGFGPGFSFGRIVRFNLMLGYGLYDVTDGFYIFPTGEIGLYYCF